MTWKDRSEAVSSLLDDLAFFWKEGVPEQKRRERAEKIVDLGLELGFTLNQLFLKWHLNVNDMRERAGHFFYNRLQDELEVLGPSASNRVRPDARQLGPEHFS